MKSGEHTGAEWVWVKFGPQCNYKIARFQLSTINFGGDYLTHTHFFIGFDYLGIPGTKNTIAKGSVLLGTNSNSANFGVMIFSLEDFELKFACQNLIRQHNNIFCGHSKSSNNQITS